MSIRCCRFGVIALTCTWIFMPHALDGQEVDRGNVSAARDAGGLSVSQEEFGRATQLVGAQVKLADGTTLGTIDDLVIDNAGRLLNVLTKTQSGFIPIPLGALSTGELSDRIVKLNLSRDAIRDVPRIRSLRDLANPTVQGRVINFFRDRAGMPIMPIRLSPSDLQVASALIGSQLQLRDRQVFGTLNDFVIDRNGQVLFGTTTLNGEFLPIPFSALWLGDLANGFVAVDFTSRNLLDAPRIRDLTRLDLSFRDRVTAFFEDAARARAIEMASGNVQVSQSEVQPRNGQLNRSNLNGPDLRSGSLSMPLERRAPVTLDNRALDNRVPDNRAAAVNTPDNAAANNQGTEVPGQEAPLPGATQGQNGSETERTSENSDSTRGYRASEAARRGASVNRGDRGQERANRSMRGINTPPATFGDRGTNRPERGTDRGSRNAPGTIPGGRPSADRP